MKTYDKCYSEDKDFFGKSYPGLIKFFKNYSKRGKLLDLGCGQGRDSISLAKLGYDVTGIDNSKVGITQMLETSKLKKLNLTGIVDDIYKVKIPKKYDFVLLDSMFHFEKKDYKKEKLFLERIIKEIKNGGVIAIFVWKSKRIENELLKIINNQPIKLKVLEDKYVKYPKYNMEYRMYIVQKIKN